MDQSKALDIILSEHNVFLTGPPGSGKSYLLKIAIRELQRIKKVVAITASTGIAAVQIDGLTIHSWSKISEYTKNKTFYDFESDKEIVMRYRKANVLIIDEISMLDYELFEKINNMAKFLRKNSKPFGGIKLILVGDFFQLPPVKKDSNEKVKYLFESSLWNELDLKICYLNTQYRQKSDNSLIKVLENIRNNNLDSESIRILKERIVKPKDNSIIKLYSHNYDVEIENEFQNNLLDTRARRYKPIKWGINKYLDNLMQDNNFSQSTQFKIGSKVIFILNRPNLGYVNGTKGEVIDFRRHLPVVLTEDGKNILVDYQEFSMEINNLKVASVNYLPLKLAWAITIHKSQGMSLDSAEIDLSRSFSPGMGYVALSRVRSLEGLFLKGLNRLAFLVDYRVIDVDKDWLIKSKSI